MHTIYSYVLVLIGTLLLVWTLFRLPGIYKSQTAILLIGISIPWISNILSIADLSPSRRLDLTPLAFTAAGALFAWGLFRLRLLDLVPVARDLVIETMTDGLIVLDARDRIVDVNPPIANVIGLPISQIIGKPVDQVFQQWREVVRAFRDVTNTQTEIAIDEGATRRHPDLRISPIHDQQGRILGRAITVRDVSDAKRVERALHAAKETAEAANRAKTIFLTSVGNELRAPLRNITEYSATLLAEAKVQGLKTFEGYLVQIRGAGRHLLAIADRILSLSKIESGKMPLLLRVFDLGDVLRDAINTLQPLAGKNGNTLELICEEKISGMNADKEKIHYTINCLLENACKFTRQGRISLNTTRETRHGTDWYVMTVRDTGREMTPEQLARVFEPFTQADASITREFGTTSLSLAISQWYRVMLGGALVAQSEPGNRSTFTVCLPVRVDTDPKGY